jgi:tetratricopeptide (TPR) repeat protein
MRKAFFALLMACGDAVTPVKTPVVVSTHYEEQEAPYTPRLAEDDPQVLRPNYGSADLMTPSEADLPRLHAWWPLADTEVSALKEIDKAKAGDAHALFVLALVASGDHRDSASFEEYQRRFDQFIAGLKPTIAAADAWHKGNELNRAMHRVFFKTDKDKADLGGYQLDQSHLTNVFTTGKFNCLSSTLLYIAAARALGIEVRGVLEETHAFAEIGPRGGKVFDVETTTKKGFGTVHDARFFKLNADWATSRGLRPATMLEYQQREIVDPYRFVARAMLDGRAGETDDDRKRIAELAVALAPDDPDVQKRALGQYINEAFELFDKKGWRTILKMCDLITPTLTLFGSKTTDPEVRSRIAWLHWYHAYTLVIAQRADEAIRVMDQGLSELDPTWKDYTALRQNFVNVLMAQLLEDMHAKNYPAAIQLIAPRLEVCKSDANCSENLAIIYYNQAVRHHNRGDRRSARAALQECVAVLPQERLCADSLMDLYNHRTQ